MKLDELKFKKGDFITQNNSPESFAIFGGDIYESEDSESETLYSLICYYNPSHYEQNSDGKWIKQSVIEYDFEDNDHDETCEYTIGDGDFDFWRLCSKREIEAALKMLAETKKLAWDDKTNKFRKLGPNERLVFDEPKSTGACGGNVNRGLGINPFYGKGQQKTVKLITRSVKDDWEQKEPICTMNDEKREFVAGLCEKTRIYTTCTTGATRVYPTCGAQVPRRTGFGYCSWPDAMGYGMCAYNALMNGEMWGAYDDYGD